MGRKAGIQFLSQHSISQYIDEVICRDDTKGVGELSKRLEFALDKLEILPEECIYFCNRLSDLKVAKSANFQIIVLPSRKEKANDLIKEGPNGMIISLEEIPSLLSIETFKATPREEPPEISGESMNNTEEIESGKPEP